MQHKTKFIKPRLQLIIYYSFENMKTKLLLFIMLFLLTFYAYTEEIECNQEKCPTINRKLQKKIVPLEKAFSFVDRQARRLYWFYLRRAEIVYESSINTSDRYIFFFLYRNVVGTFLCIGSWNKSEGVQQINTIVRLGNGSVNKQLLEQPVKVQPFLLSLRLAEGEYKIELNQQGKFLIQAEFIELGDMLEEQNKGYEEIQKKIQKVDRQLRWQYWYFIGNAKLTDTSNIITNQKIYVLLTYVSSTGTYFSVSTCTMKNQVSIRTFVRLGETIDESLPPAVKINPLVFRMS